MVTTIDSDSEDDLSSIFQEPESFRAPPPKPTKVTYTLQRGSPSLHLNLIGSSPLWGHILWHTSTTLAGYLEQRPSLVRGKSILEFGAGAGLPGLVSAILGAKTVCVTDYPDVELVQNLESNVVGCRGMWDSRADVVAEVSFGASLLGYKVGLVMG